MQEGDHRWPVLRDWAPSSRPSTGGPSRAGPATDQPNDQTSTIDWIAISRAAQRVRTKRPTALPSPRSRLRPGDRSRERGATVEVLRESIRGHRGHALTDPLADSAHGEPKIGETGVDPFATGEGGASVATALSWCDGDIGQCSRMWRLSMRSCAVVPPILAGLGVSSGKAMSWRDVP